MHVMRDYLLSFFLLFSSCQYLPPLTQAVPPHYEIGVVGRPVSTSNAEAQLWFDRGLALTWGYNNEEAIVCFERAAELDPGLAMAHWGKAYALGTNYNSPTMTDDASRAAYESLQRALERLDGVTPVERDLVLAMRARYAWPAPADRMPLEQAYAAEMRELRAAYPDDADIAAMTAEALMQLRPWKLWSREGVPAPETPEIVAVLEAGLARWPDHPVLCHLYIHATEASPNPSSALPAARRLEDLVPGVGHLVHMPSHTYVWTGKYDDVVRVNLAAVEADERFVEHAGRNNVYTLYRVHNYHFVAYGGMFEGRRELALDAAREIERTIPAELIASMPDLTEVFLATPYHVLVRFGRWDEILAEPEPRGAELMATRAVWRYARGVAFASLGRVEEAQREQELFLQAKAAVPPTRLLFQNEVARVLEVAERVLAGEIAYRAGEVERGFALLREAIALDERLNYDEPWGWMEPAQHALGALLVDQGRYQEALEVYQANLKRYPENGWALHGLGECLEELGREREAAEVRARFEIAWARADTPIPGSCFCRVRPEASAVEAQAEAQCNTSSAALDAAGPCSLAAGEPVEHRATLATGIDARWIELGDPRGEPVLFLHGYTDTSRSFLDTMRELARLRPELRLIAPDLRGHGGTSLPREACADEPAHCFGPDDFVADALALLDHVGLERVNIVGHSLGTFVGQELALSHPERVERLVLLATTARVGGNPVTRSFLLDGLVEGPWKEALVERGLAFPRDAWALVPSEIAGAADWLAENWVVELGTDPALLAAMHAETVRVPLSAWLGVQRALLDHDNRERLADLRVPTLVLWPIQDAFFPEQPDQSELRAALARAHERHGTPWAWKRYGREPLPASGVQSDIGHNFHWAVPGAVARDLAAFLRPGGAPTTEETYLAPEATHREDGALVLGERSSS